MIGVSFHLAAQQPVWTEVAPGVWKATVGKPEALDLLKAAGATPNKEGLGAIASAGFPLAKTDIVGRIQDGKAYLRFPLQKKNRYMVLDSISKQCTSGVRYYNYM
ncbi:hypothetical protein [Paraflavitalea speifideaquila]|uniref:hypothetical protein n=1 Tax=Paraflavitalea speifideaquila TaxID=3076558 RepID=UPI0028E88992|nr:hypothetical protein [Paraflavitalea speifideiaquila]